MSFKKSYTVNSLFFLSFTLLAQPSNDILKSAQEKYQRGVQLFSVKNANQKIDYKEAASLFKDVQMKAADQGQAGKNLQELATLALARLYYEEAFLLPAENPNRVQIMKKAIEAYQSIPRFSVNWSSALFEQAWACTVIEDYGAALGALHSLKHSYFSYDFYPEAYILEAIVYWYNCQWVEAEGALKAFEENYVSLVPDLQKLLKNQKTNIEWSLWLDNTDGDFKAIKSYLKNEKLNYKFQSAFSRLKEFRKTNSFSVELEESLLQTNKNLQHKSGAWIHDFLNRMLTEIKDIEVRAGIISLEIKTAQAEWLGEQNSLMAGNNKPTRYFIQDDKHFFYWSKPTERWLDELGFYRFSIISKCYE